MDETSLSDIEKTWIQELQSKIDEPVNINTTVEDLKTFFSSKKDNTASSASGHHMGHYKVVLDQIFQGDNILTEIIITIANISLRTSRPLLQWKKASQIILEKGKGQFIEHP
jgi:hypothetical protein